MSLEARISRCDHSKAGKDLLSGNPGLCFRNASRQLVVLVTYLIRKARFTQSQGVHGHTCLAIALDCLHDIQRVIAGSARQLEDLLVLVE
jgi:hypothetical protein